MPRKSSVLYAVGFLAGVFTVTSAGAAQSTAPENFPTGPLPEPISPAFRSRRTCRS
jgi:hypothetical protein